MGIFDSLLGRPDADAPRQAPAAPGGPPDGGDGRASLERRRDELLAQVAELHWDLGGLAYEMAIRDHFRLDVLVRRAGELQERDAELGELERVLSLREHVETGTCPDCGAVHGRGALYCWQCGKVLMERVPSAAANGSSLERAGRRGSRVRRPPRPPARSGLRSRHWCCPQARQSAETSPVSGDSPVPAQPPETCSECGSPLAGDQRYCLSCGARNGPRPPALERILEGLDSGGRAPVAPPAAPRRSRGGLPSPLTAAVLTLAMLGFGTVTGAAASNDPSGALNALRRGPLTLLVPAPAASTRARRCAPAGRSSAHAGSVAFELRRRTEAPPRKNRARPRAKATSTRAKAARKAPAPGPKGEAPKLPPVKHVFLIVLADQAYAQTFGPESPAPYIAHTLEHQGELLVRFYGVAHEELADEVALISGLGPTPQTAADCPTFSDIVPGQANSKGQYTGQGCIYPKEAQTVGEQLAAKGLTWKVYAEGLGDVSGGAAAPGASGSSGAVAPGASRSSGAVAPKAIACWHPEFGAADPTSQAPQGDTFATFRDPFSYFDGVLHSPECTHDDLGIEGLAGDLKSAKRTPGALLHRARPLPRRASHPVRARCAERAARRRNVPAPRRPRDPRLPRLPQRRAADHHHRSGAHHRGVRRLQLLLHAAALPRAGGDHPAGEHNRRDNNCTHHAHHTDPHDTGCGSTYHDRPSDNNHTLLLPRPPPRRPPRRRPRRHPRRARR